MKRIKFIMAVLLMVIVSCQKDPVPGVTEYAVPAAVDLGLSVKWASFNLGASKPEEYGNYYAWGETETKSDYSWSTYKWCNGSEKTLSKYNNWEPKGVVDNKSILEKADDVAYVKLGGKWRMPTYEEVCELVQQCTSSWTTRNGVEGIEFFGPNGNSLFLPAAGCWEGTDFKSAGYSGVIWTSTASFKNGIPEDAFELAFHRIEGVGRWWIGAPYRCYGYSVRPVTE